MDTWPERIGIPTIKQAEKELVFVFSCLDEENEAQSKARENLRNALAELKKAELALKG